MRPALPNNPQRKTKSKNQPKKNQAEEAGSADFLEAEKSDWDG